MLEHDARQWQTPMADDARSTGGEASRADGRQSMLNLQAKTWQTPTTERFRTRGGDRADEEGLDPDTLTAQTTMWATPDTARRGTETPESRAARQAKSGGGCSNLLVQAEYWPTPNAQVSNDGETPEAWNARNEKLRDKGYNGNGMGTPLTIAATTWPTPAARDVKGDYSDEAMVRKDGKTRDDLLPNVASRFSPQAPETASGGTCSTPVVSVAGSELSPTKRAAHVLGRRRLNPAFVCWLMGWPWWWTRAEPTSFGAAETALWRSKMQWHLCSLLDAP